MPLGTEVGIGPGHIVLDGDPASPFFCPWLLWPKTAGWIKMALGTEICLGPGHIVLDGDPAPLPPKGGRAPNFQSIFIVAKRLDASRCHLVYR